MIQPIPDRSDFAAIAQRYFYQTGNAAEIGVFRYAMGITIGAPLRPCTNFARPGICS